MIRKIISVILLLSVLVTTSCSNKPFSIYDTPIKFSDPFLTDGKDMKASDLQIVELNADDVISRINKMKELSQTEGSLEDIKALYKKNYNDMNQLYANATISKLMYDIDSHNASLSEASLKHESICNNLFVLYNDAIETILDSSYAEEMKKFIGEDVAGIFKSNPHDTDKLRELLDKESTHINEYMKLLATPLTVTVDGEEWDINKLYENMNSLPNEKYMQIYLELDKSFNKKAIEIYIPLVEIRRQIAKEYGYDNVAEYYYKEVFTRDFSPEEALIFHKNVKEYIAPVSSSLPSISFDAVIESETVLPSIAKILPLISHELSEIFDKMNENGLCILKDDITKSFDGGYTTGINIYNRPLIYNAIYGNYRSISDTVHEFGHYCDYYLNAIYSPCYNDMCYDISEVSSTGLEALFYDYYDQIIENCNDEKAHFIGFLLSSVADGCYMDEAQQKIYNYEGELTEDIINDIFAETAANYGKTDDYYRYTWAQVSHNFISPFYYISYATSSIAALEIWNVSQTEGKEKAAEIYLKILSDGSFEYGYNESIKKNGLKGFADSDNLKNIAECVKKEIDKLMTAQ